MMDQRFDRDYQAARATFHDSIDHFIRDAMASFRALDAIQFAAPWQQKAARRCDPARPGLTWR